MFAVVHSQFGRTLVGIRENTARMRAVGDNVRRYKLAAFLFGAAFAGLPSLATVLIGVHWLGAPFAVALFALWCARAPADG